MKKIIVLFFGVLWSLTALADYTLSVSSIEGMWSSSVSGSTITFSSWGGAGWWLGGMDCSSYNSVVVNFNSASQEGNLQVYYSGETDPGEKVQFGVGATSVSANLNTSKRSSVEKIVVSCESGNLTITSAYLSGSGTGGGDDTGGTTVVPTGSHGFIVSGTQLLDAKNNPFVIRGTNLAYAWMQGSGYRDQIATMRSKGANAVRVCLATGDQYSKVSSSTLSAMIKYCEEQKMVLIVDVHDFTGSDTQSDVTSKAYNYWKDMASTLKGHEHTVIINIANEWGGTWNASSWKSVYKSVIPSLRSLGLNHCLMVDADGWGQHASTITTSGKDVLSADPNKNIIFSIHMYGTAGKSGSVESNITNVLNQSLCLCIGEFGWYHSDGDVDEDAIISTCKSYSVGWCSWSWYGNGGGVEYLDMVTNQWNGSPATQSTSGKSCAWGQKIYDAWKADGKLCTVYTDVPPSPSAISEVDMNENNLHTKYLLDGKIYILHGGVLYDVCGHPVHSMQ